MRTPNLTAILSPLAALAFTAVLAAQPASAADTVATGLYFNYPVPTSYASHFYELDNRGNGGYGGSLSISRDSGNGNDLMLHLAEGASDIYYYDFNLTTGTITWDVSHPGGPIVYQGRKGEEVIAFTKAVVLLRNRADLLRDGITSQNQNQTPDAAAKPVADYLDAFVAQELNGGKARNGITFCGGNTFGDQYACGDYLCAKTDDTYAVPCVVSKR